MTVRILLDTNVWRRISDAEAGQRLRRAASSVHAEILVAPAVVYEMLRTPDKDLRAKLLKVVTLGTWTRLMPEVYDECQDMLEVMKLHRPQWVNRDPDLRYYYRLRADWRGGRGFWWRARTKSGEEGDYLMSIEGELLPSARVEASARRKTMMQLQYDSVRLTGWHGRPSVALPGWRGDEVDWWRLDGSQLWWRALISQPNEPYVNWLGPFLDLGVMATLSADWNQLWFYEVEAAELPREWARWAVMFLQSLRKVTPGTPADNQIALYAYHADVFVSGDSALVEIVNRVRDDAPSAMAQAFLLHPSQDAVDAIAAVVQAFVGETTATS